MKYILVEICIELHIKKKKRQEILYWLHYSFSYLIQQNHAVLEHTSYRYVNVFRIQNYFVK